MDSTTAEKSGVPRKRAKTCDSSKSAAEAHDETLISHNGKHTSRQQPPVSCRFCRTRKLRCNRAQPCSNCVSRNILCQNADPRPESTASPDALSGVPAPSSSRCVDPDADIISRLDRLEQLIAIQTGRWSELTAHHSELFRTDAPSRENDPMPFKIDTTFRAPSQRLLPTPLSGVGLGKEVAKLEQISYGKTFPGLASALRINFEVGSVKQLAKRPVTIKQSTLATHTIQQADTLCIRLPYYTEMQIILEKYIHDLNCFHHVVHVPTLRDTVHDIYLRLNEHGHIPLGHVVLLVSIISSTSYFWTEDDCSKGVFANAADASNQAILWARAAHDLVDACTRSICLSIEAVQGIIILTFVIGNIEGLSFTYRTLLNQALVMSRELGLHRIDHPGNTHKLDPIQAEVGRRVWWHLAATDWLIAARYTGPNEGVYQTGPRRMTVMRPCNVNDDEILSYANSGGKPLDQATVVSYLLQRIRLAETSRNLLDRKSLITTASSDKMSYSAVLEADTELENFINSLPPFFRPVKGGSESADPLRNMEPNIIIQRYFINSLLQFQRCRLHLPYLAHDPSDPVFEFSRKACLESARLIIQLEMELEQSGVSFVKTRLELTGVLSSPFLASIALFMDLCLKGSSSQQELRHGEVGQAVRILEAAGRQSSVAATLLQSMIQILRKHSIELPRTDPRSKQQGPPVTEQTMKQTSANDVLRDKRMADNRPPSGTKIGIGSAGMSIMSSTQHEQNGESSKADIAPDQMDLMSYFDELAETWGDSATFDETSWNAMLSELDTSFL